MAESLINLKHRIHESKWIFKAFAPAKVVIYLRKRSSDLAGFSIRVRNFPAFETSLRFGFLVYNKFVFGFSVCFLKMELNSVLQSFKLNCSVPGWRRTQEAKLCRFLTFIWQDCDIYLIGEPSCLADMWKHFKYWLSSSNPLFNYWTYFPKDCCMMNSKTKIFLLQFKFQLLTNFIECFAICS